MQSKRRPHGLRPRQHALVRILQQVLPRRQQMVGSRQRMRQTRVVRGVVRRHLGVHSRRPTHVEPTAGGRVYVPPGVRRRHGVAFNASVVCGTGHRVKGPRFVRVPRVDRAEVVRRGGALHLAQQRGLVVVHVGVVCNSRL